MPDTKASNLLDQLRRRLQEALFSVNPNEKRPKPPRIFHYCSADGLYGILHTKSFWATDMFCLNDASEMSYAIELAKSTVNDSPLDQYLYNPRSIVDAFRTLNSHHVVCFSAEDDLLSQWRAYGAAGRGFTLGFHCDAFQSYGFEAKKFALFPFLYSEEDQVAAMSSFVQQCSRLEAEFSIDVFWWECFFKLLNLLMQFKNPKFSEEKEWRLWQIRGPGDQVKFRPVHGSIIPYIEVPFDKSLLVSLRQGPTSNAEFGRVPLKMLLDAEGFSGIEPGDSKIPLRSLVPS
jgi:hypothetical protein